MATSKCTRSIELNQLDGVLANLGQILAKLECVGAVFAQSNNIDACVSDGRAVMVLDGCRRELDDLYNSLDRAIVEVSRAQRVQAVSHA